MSYTIEKGVPLPSGRRERRDKYPYADMEVGDSFLIPLAKDRSTSGIYASVSVAKRRHNINLATARVDGGVRIWRIALTTDNAT